jgi:hypothetical protein
LPIILLMSVEISVLVVVSMKMAVSWDVGAMLPDRNLPTFQRSLHHLMMEAESASATSVSFYQTIQCNILEDSHLQGNC